MVHVRVRHLCGVLDLVAVSMLISLWDGASPRPRRVRAARTTGPPVTAAEGCGATGETPTHPPTSGPTRTTSQLTCFPAVRVHRAGFLYMKVLHDKSEYRLTGIPAHPPITPSSPPSSSLATSQAKQRLNKMKATRGEPRDVYLTAPLGLGTACIAVRGEVTLDQLVLPLRNEPNNELRRSSPSLTAPGLLYRL